MATAGSTALRSYRCSGKVRWGRFFPRAMLVLATAVAMGVFLQQMNRWGFYFVILMPFLAVLPVAGLVIVSVGSGHCRSPFAGGLLGMGAAILMYLTYYHCGFVELAGVGNIRRVDVLPNYIWFRLHTDVIQDAQGPPRNQPGNRPQRADFVMNLLAFLIELGMICAFVGGLGCKLSSGPYDERNESWLVEETMTFTQGTGQLLANAVQSGDLENFAASRPARVSAGPPCTKVTVYYGSTVSGRQAPAPVYLTVDEIEIRMPVRKHKQPAVRSVRLLRQVEIEPAEVNFLASVFPVLATRPEEPAVVPRACGSVADRAVAKIRPVPDEYAKKVLTSRHLLICTLLGLLPLYFMALGFALLAASGWAFEQRARVGPPAEDVRVIVFPLLGIGSFVIGLLVVRVGERLGNRHLYRVACAEFQWRPDRLVDPGDPDALFVEVIPRRNFQRIMVETATDVGFLLLDARRRLILFEGDRERYRIPFEALESCAVEQVRADVHHDRRSHYAAVLRAIRCDVRTPWEAPLALRYDEFGDLNRKTKLQRAKELHRRILSLVTLKAAGSGMTS